MAVSFDHTAIDGLVDGIGRLPQAISMAPRRLPSGAVGGYAFVMLTGVVVAVVFVVRALAGN
jgi:hypothetical protein